MGYQPWPAPPPAPGAQQPGFQQQGFQQQGFQQQGFQQQGFQQPGVQPGPPPPPPGPGVQPPFPAPPVEGKGRRVWLGLGIGAGVLLLICGGGAAAVVGLGKSASKALDEQARKAVTEYLGALHDLKYEQAYAMLCDQAKEDESPAQYRSRVAAMQPIADYTLGSLDLVNLSIPVDATYTNGDNAELEAYLGQNQTTGAFEVCDLGE
jgi:hypothetical protein